MADTTNFGWTKPTNGGSSGSWGTELNTLFDDADSDLNTVKTTADAALPKAGGTMTGAVKLLTDNYTVVNSGNLTGAATFDLSAARRFYGTVTGNVTSVTFSNTPATGTWCEVVLELTNPGAFTITWGSSVKWPGGAAPSFTASGVDVVVLYTRDGGTTWRAARSMADSE